MMSAAYCPSFGGVVNVTSEALPNDPDLAVAATVRRMIQYAVEDSGSAVVRGCLQDALSYASTSDGLALVEAVHAWVRAHVIFEEDEVKGMGAGYGPGNEVLVRPIDVLSMPVASEDCDGFSMLTASMLLAARDMYHLPLRIFFVTLGTDPTAPDQFTHVYCYVTLGQGRGVKVWPVDSSHGSFVGWQAADRFGKKAFWPVGGSMFAKSVNFRPLSGVPVYGGHHPGLRGIRRMGDDPVVIDNSVDDEQDPSFLSSFDTGISSIDNQAEEFLANWTGTGASGTTYASSTPGDTTNWTSVINNLIAQGGTVAKADITGTTIRLPNGQVITYAGVVPNSSQVAAATKTTLSTSNLMLFGALGLGAFLLLGRR